MGKKSKKMKTTRLDLGGKKLIEFHTAKMNKHGELKGSNKKETRVIRDTCCHHRIGKKGKVRSRVDIVNGEAHCTMCNSDFRAKPYSKEERKQVIGDITEFANHTKFMAAAIGAGEDTLRSLAEFSVGIDNVERINKTCTKIVKKEDQISKKNKKNSSNSSSNLGNWSIRKR